MESKWALRWWSSGRWGRYNERQPNQQTNLSFHFILWEWMKWRKMVAEGQCRTRRANLFSFHEMIMEWRKKIKLVKARAPALNEWWDCLSLRLVCCSRGYGPEANAPQREDKREEKKGNWRVNGGFCFFKEEKKGNEQSNSTWAAVNTKWSEVLMERIELSLWMEGLPAQGVAERRKLIEFNEINWWTQRWVACLPLINSRNKFLFWFVKVGWAN